MPEQWQEQYEIVATDAGYHVWIIGDEVWVRRQHESRIRLFETYSDALDFVTSNPSREDEGFGA